MIFHVAVILGLVFIGAIPQASKAANSGAVTFYATAGEVSAPTDLLGHVVTNTSVSVFWTKGAGSQKTKLLYKAGSYPTTYTDGIVGYFDTGTSVVIDKLELGTAYYFRAWAFVADDYWSSGYQELILNTPVDETLAERFVISGSSSAWEYGGNISVPNGFYYGSIGQLASNRNMSPGLLFMVLFAVMLVSIGIFTYWASRNFLVLALVVMMYLGGFVLIGIMPLWIVLLYAVIAGGSWYATMPRED